MRCYDAWYDENEMEISAVRLFHTTWTSPARWFIPCGRAEPKRLQTTKGGCLLRYLLLRRAVG